MKVFIWRRADHMTTNYHPEGRLMGAFEEWLAEYGSGINLEGPWDRSDMLEAWFMGNAHDDARVVEYPTFDDWDAEHSEATWNGGKRRISDQYRIVWEAATVSARKQLEGVLNEQFPEHLRARYGDLSRNDLALLYASLQRDVDRILAADAAGSAPKMECPWISTKDKEPPCDNSTFVAWTPESQRGAWDWCYRDTSTREVMVMTTLGWEPLANFGGWVSHWFNPRDYPPKPGDAPEVPCRDDEHLDRAEVVTGRRRDGTPI